jgi:hypothetical protein
MFDGRSTWRAFKLDQSYKIELTTAQLFVRHEELIRVVALPSTIVSIESDAEAESNCHTTLTPNPRTTKHDSPPAATKALHEFLEEIDRRMCKKGLKLNRSEMLGTRKDLQEIAEKYNPLFCRAESTFKDYLKNICKFSPGRCVTNAENPYAEFFPEYFNKGIVGGND